MLWLMNTESMTEVPSPPPAAPTLPDPWDARGAIPLDRVLERQQYPPFLMALVGLVLAFILFQVVISPIATVALLMVQGVAIGELVTQLEQLIEEHAVALLTANTIGQVFGLALPAWLLTRLHTTRPGAFLRLRRSQAGLLVLGALGLVALLPLVQWLGNLNSSLPLPDFVRAFEESQMALIEKVLNAETGLLFNLVVLAVTPAFCEELLFRGYVQRQLERGTGAAWGILLSGLFFGFYHLRLTQVIPLSVLGVYLAYLVWRTGSLWPAILVHFLNNAMAVLLGAYMSARPELEQVDIERIEVPWYFVVAGTALFLLILRVLHPLAQQYRAQHRAGASPDQHTKY